MSGFEFYLIVYALIVLIGRLISLIHRKKVNLLEQFYVIIRDPSAIMLVIASFTAFTLPLVEVILRGTIDFNFFSFLNGFLFLGLGWTLSYIANMDLAENWSAGIGRQDHRVLVTGGSYQIIRHPLYLSGLLLLIGTHLYFQNTWSWISFSFIIPTLLIRISLEEKELVRVFGEDFLEYRQRTKALIPWIL